jgi:hypothetical protein
MTRPGDWSPLRGSDPTPGDPDAVGAQARHYDDVAAELRAQVSRLRRIGRDSELTGQYVDSLRAAADGLVGDLEQVERRYARVATALHRWEPDLREGQDRADSIRLRARALDDERRELHRLAGTVGRSQLADDPTPSQQAAFDADQASADRIRRRLADIDEELRGLDRELGVVEDRVHADGRAVAHDIRSAVSDDIEDTTWEDVKGIAPEVWATVDSFIDHHINWIQKLVELLQVVATALAIAALFIPGINLIVLAIAAGAVLVAASLLYATGNGSFTDLLLAIVGVATLGLGSLATAVLRSARAATLLRAAPRAGARAAAATGSQTQAARAAIGRRLGRRLQPAQRAQARAELDRLEAQARAAAARAEREYLQRPLPEPTGTQSLRAGGDRENAQLIEDIMRMRADFSADDVLAAGRGAIPALRLAQVSFPVGHLADLVPTAVGKSELFPDKPYVHEFEEFKNSWDPIR